MNLTIRTKLILAFLLVISIGVVAIAINFTLLNSLSQKTHHIIDIVDPAEIAVYDLQNSFNEDIRAIEEYGNGFAELDETEKIVHEAEAKIESDIKKIESSDLAHSEYVQSLKEILAKDEAADEKVFDLKKSAKSNLTKPEMSSDLRQALISFDLINDEVNKTIDGLVDNFKEHKAEKIKEFEDSIHQNRLYITAAFTGSILISLLLAFLISFALSASIKKVRDTALDLSKGDLTQRVSISSKDEVGDLANAFNQMADNIEKSQTDLKDAQVQLKEKIVDLEKFKELTVGRELKMIELKKEIDELKKKS